MQNKRFTVFPLPWSLQFSISDVTAIRSLKKHTVLTPKFQIQMLFISCHLTFMDQYLVHLRHISCHFKLMPQSISVIPPQNCAQGLQAEHKQNLVLWQFNECNYSLPCSWCKGTRSPGSRREGFMFKGCHNHTGNMHYCSPSTRGNPSKGLDHGDSWSKSPSAIQSLDFFAQVLFTSS